jgi:zinc/manganese transport system permease protein
MADRVVTVLAGIPGLTDMLSHPFMRNALLAGTAIALACGLVGYFLVLRSQIFSADALSHVSFTGALGALAFGYDLRLGLFASVIVVAVLLAALGERGRADDITIGSVFVWVLGLGVLFLSLFTTSRAATNSTAGTSVLFGSIYGLDSTRTQTAVIIGLLIAAALVAIARPLLFASIDEAVAAARGIPVRALSYGFLVLVGLAAAEATQAIGALLLLALLAAPAAAAQRITARPYAALLLSAAIAIACTWTGLILSYRVPSLPPSVSIVASASITFAVALACSGHGSLRSRRG